MARLVLRVTVGNRTVDKILSLAVDDLLLLFSHRLAQSVRFGQGKAGDLDRDPHHLLLVHDDSVRFTEDLLEFGEDVGDRLAAMLAIRVVVDELHRTRTVEGVEGGDVEEALRLHLAQHLLHARGLELEYAVGIAGRKERIDICVVEWDVRQVEVRVFRSTD